MSSSHGPPSPGEGPSLDLLATLDVLLELRSVTRAAQRLGITQSAMSHKLRQLRESLGDPLLVNTRGGMALTERAQRLAAPLREALRGLREVVRTGEPFDPSTASRSYVISTVDLVEFTMLGLLLEDLQRVAPGVSLVVESTGPNLLSRLDDGSIDLAIGGPSAEAGEAVVRRKLLRDGFLVAARRGHPAFRGGLTLESYVALPHLLISPRGLPGSIVDDALAERGLRRTITLRLPHFTPAPFLAARSPLVLTAPAGLIVEACQFVDLEVAEPPLPLPEVQSFLVWHARQQHDEGHRWLRETIEQAATSRAGLLARSVQELLARKRGD